MIYTKITCDTCHADITESSDVSYRLVLAHECRGLIGAGPGSMISVKAMYITPPLHRPHHFCGLNCLKAFVLLKLP